MVAEFSSLRILSSHILRLPRGRFMGLAFATSWGRPCARRCPRVDGWPPLPQGEGGAMDVDDEAIEGDDEAAPANAAGAGGRTKKGELSPARAQPAMQHRS